ncbi:MAG: DNA methyltransferase [Waterburya sp.]
MRQFAQNIPHFLIVFKRISKNNANKVSRFYTNPNDLVFSPFTGIGSEGYVSIDLNRRFIGAELKESYFNCAVSNLQLISNSKKQLSLFA